MDCTFCLDCIHACPHDTIGMIAGTPAAELWRHPPRSGIGRFSKRTDLAALVLVLVFGAFANAAGMVGPVADGQDWLQQSWGQQTPLWPMTAYSLCRLLVLPLLAVLAADWLIRCWAGLSASWLDTARRTVYVRSPLGTAMQVRHYC